MTMDGSRKNQVGSQSRPSSPDLLLPARRDASGTLRAYVRVATLGDSVTFGLGDATTAGYRGWARILASAIADDHDVSFCNLARPGATAADVRYTQLPDAVDHKPHLASLIVGLNDTLRSSWDPEALRHDLTYCAEQLTEHGALLLTARFHDHGRVFRLPQFLARRLMDRIEILNDIYADIYEQYGGLQVDLGAHPGVLDREFWTVDRLHPSELGHRALAHEFAELLSSAGLEFSAPGLDLNGNTPTRRSELHWLCSQGAPWLMRRARDLGASAIRRPRGPAR
jgi:lysophospholipase L1-like esterase